MQDYEKLGVFYLGRRHDLAARKTTSEWMLLESKDLVTHAMVVGMTGSGKTGLGVDLLEEAALDGIPALVIDPKGDMGNLLLTFPELRAEDFAPWVNADEARRRGVSESAWAAELAARWAQGLAAWQQDGDRIRRMREAVELTIYTPGSQSGLPLSVLGSFGVPPTEVREDGEGLRDRVVSTVGGLLGLVGLSADPVSSREAILLGQLMQSAWGEGRDLDLADLIREVQTPPVTRVGVLDLEAFYPAKERFELAMLLNTLLASPAFASWCEGEGLDVERLLYTREGKPRLSVVSIAHLGEAERMFVVTRLLNEVLAWVRRQPGTSSLRALVYMDEIFGYFPPVANPPSKRALLTLLKQARAHGVGLVLATQNPGDLDYRGLANIGTWFVGRLQTERDRARVLEGLEGAARGSGQGYDCAALDRLVAGLGSRVFLCHSAHADGPEVFESRWSMSYLRGPLSRGEIARLMDPRRLTARVAARSGTVGGEGARVSAGVAGEETSERPVLPADVPQCFVAARGVQPAGATLLYEPRLLGVAQVVFEEKRLGVDASRDVTIVTPIAESAVPVDWTNGVVIEVGVSDLEPGPQVGGFVPPAPAAAQARNYRVWSKDLVAWLQSSQRLTLWRCDELGQVSRPGESEGEFRVRLQQQAREARDLAADRLRQKYAPRTAALEERLRRARAAREREVAQAGRAKLDTLVSVGSTLLGAFLGRRAFSATTVGRAAGTMRSAGRAMSQAEDVGRAEDTVEAVEQQLRRLEAEFQSEVDALATRFDATRLGLAAMELRPARSRVQVRLVALGWLPHYRNAVGALTPAW